MLITVTRNMFTDRSTIGELAVDDGFACFTLEDPVRVVKIAGETAIPAGTYEVVVSFSNRFKRLLPELLDVPNFKGVRIHSGNVAADTEGCLLVGLAKGEDRVGQSRAAFDALFPRIVAAAQREKVLLSIIERRPEAEAVAAPRPKSLRRRRRR